MNRLPLNALLAGLALFAGCVINPVTGDRELALVSAADEVAIGTQQYLPSQQMQGGEYTRDPALASYVRGVGQRLAAVSERALPYEFVVINSSVPNAWALPGGKIAINRGLLLELGSEAELAAVLAHEIVHAAARHGAQAMQRGMLLQGVVAIAAVAARDNDYSQLAVGAASVGAQLVNMKHGRGAELESDAYGMQYMARAGYDPGAAVSLQETFVRLSEGQGSGRLGKLFSSHPPSMERVEQNRRTAAALPAGGTVGREAYMDATARLRREAPGYEAIDAAREALANGNIAGARRDAARAGEILLDSADVAALEGEIELAADRPAEALRHFDRALAIEDRFFAYRLGKAEAHHALNQLGPAELAYRASIELLPTADAYFGLGRIAESRGNRAGALELYAQAAGSSGPAGVASRIAILRLDLPQNPERYLSIAGGLDTNGQLLVEVANPTAVEVGGIELIVSYREAGQVRQARRVLPGSLAAGARQRLATGLGPFASAADFDVSIGAARLVSAP